MRFARRRAAALAVAILVAAVSFILLTASTATSSLRIHGTVLENFRPAYDVLVRPRGSKTALERSAGLVRPNYLSGIFGGISIEAYRRILHTDGVDVAAPIANVGYVLPSISVLKRLNPYVDGAPFQLYRLNYTYVADRGRSRYPGPQIYVYYTTRDRFVEDVQRGLREIFRGRELRTNFYFPTSPPGSEGPFARSVRLLLFSRRSPGQGDDNPHFRDYAHAGQVDAGAEISFPLLIAGIDPTQEARLVGLNGAITTGRYLHAGERPFTQRIRPYFPKRYIPVIASQTAYVDEPLLGTLQRLRVPTGTELPRILASPRAWNFVSRLPSSTIARWKDGVGQTYGRLLSRYCGSRVKVGVLCPFHFWTPSNTRYERRPDGSLEPRSVSNPPSIWQSPFMGFNGGYFYAPGSNRDLQFRRLTAHVGSNQCGAGGLGCALPLLKVVGKYDPTRLRRFGPLSGVPLETYYPPLLAPANDRSTSALRGQPLLPTQNLGGYIQQPPLLLTTLQGAQAFYNPLSFSNVRGKTAAPISVIRVRVKGVTGPDALSIERIKVVAQRIHDETGLDVDITAGSSPHPLLVHLPAGKFGRPELLLREGWSKKGVSVTFLRALDRKDLLLFILILTICGFFLGNGALAAVRARRTEIGVLRTLGWPGRAIFSVVFAELLGIGALAGVVGSLLAFALVLIFGLHFDLWRVVFVVPVAMALAGAAGLGPALLAARGHPLDAVRPGVSPQGRLRRVRSLVLMAYTNLRRLPARTLLGAAGLVIGVGALTLLVAIERSFGGTLVGTLLGNALAIHVRGPDFVALGLTMALAAVSVADVLYLNLRERSPELATLRACGWSDRQIGGVVVIEALGIGALGSFLGAGIGLTLGAALLGIALSPLAAAAAIAAAGGLAVAVLASLVPLTQLARLTPHAVLATE